MLWELRFAQAQAELALARGDGQEGLRWADNAVERATAMGRPKYQALGLGSRGQALASLGRRQDALAALRSASDITRSLGDPAGFLRSATALLTLEADDALAAEAGRTAERIAAAIPDQEMRLRFQAAEPVRLLGRPSS